MKKLTQAVFNGAPDWVKSAAVDIDGEAYVFNAHVGHRAADRLRQNMVEIVCNWKSYRYATGRVMSL